MMSGNSQAELSFIGVASINSLPLLVIWHRLRRYHDNFAWGTLVLGAADLLNIDAEALYVGVLDVRGPLSSIYTRATSITT